MIERDAAIRIVEEQLEREDQRSRAIGNDATRTVVTHVEEHELVWIVSWQSEEFVRTRNVRSMLVGAGPYLVDRLDGGLHAIGAVAARTGEWEADYRARIRGLPVRTAVDDLHDALRTATASHGRLHAVRALRRSLPELSPAQALAYVNALLGDGDVPAGLAAVATRQLVAPVDPVLGVRTVRPGTPPRTS
ncbi:YrhB domain-containing protein [Streptomyces sp. NPDC047024]|uniref:YrhB domain-containing protein n=1 Tax=Streptomyces sp. NPDC047024 TaxID=3155476 RepID=UPI0033E7EDC9